MQRLTISFEPYLFNRLHVFEGLETIPPDSEVGPPTGSRPSLSVTRTLLELLTNQMTLMCLFATDGYVLSTESGRRLWRCMAGWLMWWLDRPSEHPSPLVPWSSTRFRLSEPRPSPEKTWRKHRGNGSMDLVVASQAAEGWLPHSG